MQDDRRVDRRGTITTVAGDGKAAYSGDGGPATQASLNTPQGIAFDREGALLIADTFNHVVRLVDRDGKIARFAGTVPGHGGDGGDAKDGSLFIADRANHRVKKVDSRGAIITIAGAVPGAGMMFDPAIR